MADWLVLALAASGGILALAAGSRKLLAQRHHRTSEVTLICPRSATPARCHLVVDQRSEEVVRIARCSLSQSREGRPTCEQHCVKLMNLGVSLLREEPGQRERFLDPGESDGGNAPPPSSARA
ncbi:hypothetical protein WMF31_27915 [Sorangium sp. So ce1036]|uniref:hypothetical protein n=1 Tax=Sorangium sp. So ce1036 TaxID=3133328 RepID=UPI003F0E434B